MRTHIGGTRGLSLIEVLASLAVFAILSGMVYGTFTMVQKQVVSTGADNALAEKGQRIMSYLEEDIRMLGLLLGPDVHVPYCTGGTVPNNPNIIMHNGHTVNDGATNTDTPYDTFQFITSQPVMIRETDACFSGQAALGGVKDHFLTTTEYADAAIDPQTLHVDAIYNADTEKTCYKDLAVGSDANNGRSLVTFDSLLISSAPVAGSFPQTYYQVRSIPDNGTTLTLSGAGLLQNVPALSTVYTVRQYRYYVDTNDGKRDLVRMGWDKSCGTGADATFRLVETSNSTHTAGGVDGFKVEFTFLDTVTNRLVTQATLPPLAQLRTITVWLLLRSDRIDATYTDTADYTLGSTADKIALGPYNDHYRRQLLYKTVELKNLVSIY